MTMKAMLIAGFIVGGIWTVALADSDKLPAGSISAAQVTTQLESQGFKITKIETDDGQYKVKGVNASGQKQKLKVNPLTGAVVSTDNDD